MLGRRILLLLGVGVVLVGMVDSVPAAASSPNLEPGQVLGKVHLAGQTVVTSAGATFSDAGLADIAAFTDDPELVLDTVGAGAAPISQFPRNAASTIASGSSDESGDAKEGAARSAKGLNAHDLGVTHGFAVEPPDQGLCANEKFVIEMVNLNLKVFDSNFNALTGPVVLEHFFGNPLAFGGEPNTHLTIQGDPRCVWDAGTERWYLTQLVVDLTAGTSVFQIAVSTSSNPLGTFNIFTLDNTDNSNPGCTKGCLGDQPTIGVNQDALFIDTNEFGIFNNQFNGAVIYAIDKKALAEGEPTANVVADFVGLTVPTPEWNRTTNCLAPIEGLFCWATLRPASSPNSESDRKLGGVEYFLSALDFANDHDNRVAVWAMANTRSIRSDIPHLTLSHKVMPSVPYIFPDFARQKSGTNPLGASGRFGCHTTTPCPAGHGVPQSVGPIQTNDDQFGSAWFASGLVWGGLNTTIPGSTQIGIAFFAIKPVLTKSGLGGSSIALQGYLTAKGNDVEFPSIAVTSEGRGLISFTLSGPDFFPTSAYAFIDRSGVGKVKVAALGQSPQDGFTEYRCRNVCTNGRRFRPRWGDYSAATVVEDRFVFAAEYIQFPNCDLAVFKLDGTCGGTRLLAANWGTAINTVRPSDEGKD